MAVGGPVEAFPTPSQLRSLLAADFEIFHVLIELALIDDRSDLRAWYQRIVDLQLLHGGDHAIDEPVVNLFGGDQTRGGGAALPGLVEGAIDGSSDGQRQIGVVEHDKRILAAHLELELGTARGAGLGNPGPNGGGAGEAHGGHVPIIYDGFADDRTLAHDKVEHALRQART